jgi:hypothetical protein
MWSTNGLRTKGHADPFDGYPMDRPKVGAHDLINTLHEEQPETRKDVEHMEKVSARVGLEVSTTLIKPTFQELKTFCGDLKSRDFSDYNCYFMTAICHGKEVQRNTLNVISLGKKRNGLQ